MPHPTIGKSNDERARLFTNNVVIYTAIWCSLAGSFADTKPIVRVETRRNGERVEEKSKIKRQKSKGKSKNGKHETGNGR